MMTFILWRTIHGRLQPMYSRCLVQAVSAIAVTLSISHLFQSRIYATTCDDSTRRPNIVLIMADDQGWGETSYNSHPILKTPNLDAMAANGLRFERFYAAAPVCSPTRASVLTGRSNCRTGVESHGFALRRQEKTLPEAIRTQGYRTGHFGKWHLNGLRGPGVPILKSDSHHPGIFGFERWLSVTNFFDLNPILSRQGIFEGFQGDSSEIVVDQALKFIGECAAAGQPSFSVIWFGTPHSPFRCLPQDRIAFSDLDRDSQHHYGELVAMDRSIGTLRRQLRELDIADNTLVWFCSDNGGLPKIRPSTVGGLRGFKGSLYEGGLRVPGIVEWPAGIAAPRVSHHPASTMDIFPTLAELLGMPASSMLQPQDGESLAAVFAGDDGERLKPIPFHCFGQTALIDGDYKLLHVGKKRMAYELYHLGADPSESNNRLGDHAEIASQMTRQMLDWLKGLEQSIQGKDYPEGRLLPGEPSPRFWTEVDEYRPYFNDWRDRPEYESRLR